VPIARQRLSNHVSTAKNTTKEALQCIQSQVDSQQRIQKRFHSHDNEPPKHSNSEEHDNSIVEGGDLHMVQPGPTPGR
jgi:hypothetical protein